MTLRIWTVGHSNRTISDFLEVLAAHDIEAVADVRRYPGSRRLPQFETEALAGSLGAHGIAYCWISALGGRRRPDAASPNIGWRHPSFRAYADHVLGEEFADGLFELLVVAGGLRTAIMCAEILWWRCHRRLIADVLVSLGAEVVHLRDVRPGEVHQLAPPARIVRGRLAYGG
jgi:uncharacterized protein (DUF488 family)